MRKTAETQYKEYVEKLKPGELYLTVSGNEAKSAYYKTSDGVVVEGCIHTHFSAFQDVVLIQITGEVDFRYFPERVINDLIVPYYWSCEIKKIIINNVGNMVVFAGSNKSIVCESGKETSILSGDYCGEWLILVDTAMKRSICSNIT